MSGKILTSIIVAPFALLVAGIGGCELTKAYYDWQVRQMCEKDGGATIVERIAVSPEAASKMRRIDGNFAIATERVAPPEDIAFLRDHLTTLRDGQLTIQRREQAIVRRSDGKVVGRVVRYSRAGGDFLFTVSNPTVVSCPALSQYYADIAKVFVVKGETK